MLFQINYEHINSIRRKISVIITKKANLNAIIQKDAKIKKLQHFPELK